MGRSVTDGPLVVSGNVNPVYTQDGGQGPSVFFQGSMLVDPRQAGQIGSEPNSWRAYALGTKQDVVALDFQPAAKSTTLIAAAQATVANTAMTLASADATGLSCAVPIVPWSGGAPQAIVQANVVTRLALDFGFTTGTTTAASKTVTIPAGAARFFRAGQKIIITGAGASANTPLLTTVSATPAFGDTTITINDAAGQSVTGRVGNADPVYGIAAAPYMQIGGDAIADPNQLCARAVSVTGNAGSSAMNVTIAGYDVWGNPQTEVIAFAGGAVTTNGKKAFKYITSATPDTTDAGHLISVGTTDIIGIPIRSPLWEYLEVYCNGVLVTATTGYVAAVDTDPATSTTGDSKGTYAMQTASDGTVRLVIFVSPRLYDLTKATNLTYKTLFGVTPA